MSATQADHHDAELMIKVYDLRRETTLREARLTLNREFWPTSFADVQAITKPDHPLNPVWRQVTSYWEMIYAMARHGIVNPEYWMDGNGEGMLIYAKIAPWLADRRRVLRSYGLPGKVSRRLIPLRLVDRRSLGCSPAAPGRRLRGDGREVLHRRADADHRLRGRAGRRLVLLARRSRNARERASHRSRRPGARPEAG